MMKHLLVLLVTFLFNSCVAQKHSLDKTKISFIHSKQPSMDSLKKDVTVYFESGFSDSLIVRYDGKIIMRDFFKTDFSTSYTGKTLELKFEDKLQGGKFTVESINAKSMIEVRIEKGYRVIELAKVNDYWSIIYSNIAPQFE